jgi:hypothetical protein
MVPVSLWFVEKNHLPTFGLTTYRKQQLTLIKKLDKKVKNESADRFNSEKNIPPTRPKKEQKNLIKFEIYF